VWFTLEEAQRLNALDANTERRKREIKLLEEQLHLATGVEIPALHGAVKSFREIGALWKSVVQDSVTRAEKAERRLDSIWRQPILWLTIGLAIGSAAAGYLVSR
jgi:hypothetical protein